MRRSEIACFCIGACYVGALLWRAHRRKHRLEEFAPPTINEHEVERFVSRELARIRAGVRKPQ